MLYLSCIGIVLAVAFTSIIHRKPYWIFIILFLVIAWFTTKAYLVLKMIQPVSVIVAKYVFIASTNTVLCLLQCGYALCYWTLFFKNHPQKGRQEKFVPQHFCNLCDITRYIKEHDLNSKLLPLLLCVTSMICQGQQCSTFQGHTC